VIALFFRARNTIDQAIDRVIDVKSAMRKREVLISKLNLIRKLCGVRLFIASIIFIVDEDRVG